MAAACCSAGQPSCAYALHGGIRSTRAGTYTLGYRPEHVPVLLCGAAAGCRPVVRGGVVQSLLCIDFIGPVTQGDLNAGGLCIHRGGRWHRDGHGLCASWCVQALVRVAVAPAVCCSVRLFFQGQQADLVQTALNRQCAEPLEVSGDVIVWVVHLKNMSGVLAKALGWLPACSKGT